ncbi:MAG: hypothetical protein SCABRO_01314 [Candidatus Scalindua brodae]|uniref:Uncharacterized protein n=1 Tax=Candidatus Scalindua brodae TaxID=237368 RepID=A0A0B0EQI0_9BACT|nr:MAG: hypothetical protein SCABRO_01314 [Candidatus Scalindua brodae]
MTRIHYGYHEDVLGGLGKMKAQTQDVQGEIDTFYNYLLNHCENMNNVLPVGVEILLCNQRTTLIGGYTCFYKITDSNLYSGKLNCYKHNAGPDHGFLNRSLIHVIAAIALGKPIVVMDSIPTCIISSFDTSA